MWCVFMVIPYAVGGRVSTLTLGIVTLISRHQERREPRPGTGYQDGDQGRSMWLSEPSMVPPAAGSEDPDHSGHQRSQPDHQEDHDRDGDPGDHRHDQQQDEDEGYGVGSGSSGSGSTPLSTNPAR